ncbi:hypothetical protein [Providencia rettgeri]|uniref:hypothetical protein n=1 Tax=Providencia rettgeri TaxID=587 RepID=UPI0024B92F5E|nr:hypothetical protein [Providencia rettgeri]WHT81899.1 hypothetical protein KOL65_21935 [Providencia rettgeri]
MTVLILKVVSICLFGGIIGLFVKYKAHPPKRYVVTIFFALLLNDYVIYKLAPERSWLGKIPTKIINTNNEI